MKIVDVRTAVVEANYDWTFVRIYADNGLVGLGESFLAPGLMAIIGDLRPLLIGEDPCNVDRLWSKMRWAASGAGSMGGSCTTRSRGSRRRSGISSGSTTGCRSTHCSAARTATASASMLTAMQARARGADAADAGAPSVVAHRGG